MAEDPMATRITPPPSYIEEGAGGLLRAKAKWELSETSEQTVAGLVRELQISPLLARLLAVRGFADPASAGQFLHADGDSYHDPYLLDGMEAATARIRHAIRRGERIRIYGDYDADGVCATSLLSGVMAELGAVYDYAIPHRKKEGYGLNRAAIETAKDEGVGLIVTVDTGISAVEEAALAKTLGIDLIVTDHHEPPEILPDAMATLNPLKPGCPYPFKSLAGVGVAFKLAHALLDRLPTAYLWLAAIGTIADMMPLAGENRLIARQGLQQMRTAPAPGIRALCDVAGIDCDALNGGHIGFSIAPRINAGGRLATADVAVACLTADNEQEALLLARDLDRLNTERQQIVDQMAGEALDMAEALLSSGDPGRVLVLAGEDWNEGVIGIVASRVLERHYRPTIILSIDGETGLAKGSARSIPGFDLHAALTRCEPLLIRYGGHKAAAGMTMQADQIGALRQRLNDIAAEWLDEDDYVPVLRPDARLDPDEVSVEAIRQLELLEPFGMGNPQPLFLLGDLKLADVRRMGRDRKHAKLTLQADGPDKTTIEALLFGQGELTEQLASTDKVDVVGELSINEWNGMQKPQLIVRDLRVPAKQLFDWRGRSLADPMVAGWFSAPPAAGAEQVRGVLLFRQSDADLLPPAPPDAEPSEQPAVWVADGHGAVPLNGKAAALRPHLVQHLLLPVLPPDAETVGRARVAFSGLERIYAVFHDPHPYLSTARSDRESFKRVYAMLLKWKREPLSPGQIEGRLAKTTGLTTDSIRFILAVFEQLGFLAADGARLAVTDHPAKRGLDESPLYREKAFRDEVERLFLYSTAAALKRYLLEEAWPDSVPHSANA